MQYDVAVIGAGPGGYVAAIKAAQYGLSVCLIEKNKIGGTCLNVGCIPTKYLLTNSNRYASLADYSKIGINVDKFDIDFEKMMQGKDAVVAKLTGGIEYLIKKNKIELIKGTAELADENTIKIVSNDNEETIKARKMILAMGSRPLIPESFGYESDKVCDSTEALSWLKVPDSLMIIGGGVVGCELATIYSNLGTAVSIIEMQSHLILNMDVELAEFLENKLSRNGVQVLTDTTVQRIDEKESTVVATLSNGHQMEVEKVVVSIGRVPNIDEVHLESVGIAVDKGRILVDDSLITTSPNIYAIGDVCSSPFDLAHTAMKEGIVAVENIMGKNIKMNYGAIPNCVYTNPEIASVGISHQLAQESGIEVSVGRFNLAANGKAISMGEAEGFVKVIVDKNTRIILGAQMVGAHMTDIIAQMAMAVEYRMLAFEVADTVFAHPTLSEALWEALESVLGGAIHN
jgi:dihydrolipoamide dehydrogenase